MDELSPAARLIGAVNTVVNRRKLYGHITDGEGFVANLKDHGVSIGKKDIVIFGAGRCSRQRFWYSVLWMAQIPSRSLTQGMISSDGRKRCIKSSGKKLRTVTSL